MDDPDIDRKIALTALIIIAVLVIIIAILLWGSWNYYIWSWVTK